MPAAETPAEVTSSSAQPALEAKYVCTSADVEGYTLDATMLGGEYSLVFHKNGTCDFVVVGAAMPPLPWTVGDSSYVVDYYGTMMEAAWTDTGFDLDYLGTMLMHFVPAN